MLFDGAPLKALNNFEFLCEHRTEAYAVQAKLIWKLLELSMRCSRTVFLVKISIVYFQIRFSQKLFNRLSTTGEHDCTGFKLVNDLELILQLLGSFF